eukprot:CAMPEP_0194040446 /NCGR_PEP_ID=MMETSP0009_2-20130614/12442_1 /TAXON_ID=210454 /ORGANISM="Grammatophora oceanica, Strain CCMP 410" /LENGTH=203 /DNA_ID=CAMNT_0038683587 /DNA_START=8 /DNA_END=619 /DNA_ORIENTATION=+
MAEDAVTTKAGEDEEEEDLEKLQAEIARMEAEAARITQETEEMEQKKKGEPKAPASKEEAAERDGKSIYVGQVDYTATPEELLAHFEACGTVERVTIICDKITGRPKGYAYIEFSTEEAVENAVKLNGSKFKERELKVSPKRVNDPNFYFEQGGGGRGRGRGRGPGRGRGFRGGGRRGGYRGGGRGGYRGGYRGGGRGYHPYY